jgi:hypothetical protein
MNRVDHPGFGSRIRLLYFYPSQIPVRFQKGTGSRIWIRNTGYEGHKLRGKKQGKEKRDKEERQKIHKCTSLLKKFGSDLAEYA